MKNFEKNIAADRAPESVRTLEEIRRMNGELVEDAKFDLERLKPALKDLMEQIMKEQPEVIVFLDKGARIMASPMKKYLAESGEPVPEFTFYNDSPLKGLYLDNEDDRFRMKVDSDLKDLAGKKVFFIDETFSAGKGAVTIRRAADQLKMDVRYFALSRDTDPLEFGDYGYSYERPMAEHLGELDKIRNDPRFKVYEVPVGILFSKKASALYVTESIDRKTVGRYEPLSQANANAARAFIYTRTKGQLPHSRTYSEVPEQDMSWMDYDQKVRELNMSTVKTLKDEIYRAIKEANS